MPTKEEESKYVRKQNESLRHRFQPDEVGDIDGSQRSQSPSSRLAQAQLDALVNQGVNNEGPQIADNLAVEEDPNLKAANEDVVIQLAPEEGHALKNVPVQENAKEEAGGVEGNHEDDDLLDPLEDKKSICLTERHIELMDWLLDPSVIKLPESDPKNQARYVKRCTEKIQNMSEDDIKGVMLAVKQLEPMLNLFDVIKRRYNQFS
ncbi:hypothetical protein FGO68_gene4021 [Halteria grandinella]|uniref:Uncharacterized protein n=1 Tax=Halteria grandinella TaxID=5974 RepID=A0A8J8SZP0_HALGN|nr:hypothetical protein FGO68_gene4021 [Halteria grandinella]